ncbi:GNAT family N-acetyltransferase [Treponema zioleckii]|uniref:GNAT family N-acetyltransferase n=1 Tax=Treponema zioleckii TaxID=331680 RepID=UPI00168A75E0|nr:GNAT family N-acetyltransferase [Treponema zioleckii]
MTLFVRRFNELSLTELFEIYRLRVAVFVVEQKCPYQEIDDFDKAAIHVFFRDDKKDEIVAYLRVLPSGTKFYDVSIGRVISMKRRGGLGTKLLKEGIKIAKDFFNAKRIQIEAQTYAIKFYERVGFKTCSEEYLEDGIPHVKMLLELND